MLWEARSLYCLPGCAPDEILDRWLRERQPVSGRLQSAEEIRRSWISQGYTHILFYKLGADFIREQSRAYLPADWQSLQEFLSRLPPGEDFGGAYYLYKLSP
jgi:hypothetical protein